MFCKYCGQKLSDDAIFCDKCGNRIRNGTAETGKAASETDTGADNVDMNKEPPYEEPDTWYYLDGTEMGGPMPAEVIRQSIEEGTIDYNAKVRRSPSEPWTFLIDSPFADIAVKMAPAPVSISDKWLWALAVIPMTVSILLSYMKIMPAESTAGLIIPVVLNILFLLLDKKELQDKGFYAERWMWMGILLIPVYLIVREVKTNRNFVPAIIWCFLFAVSIFII